MLAELAPYAVLALVVVAFIAVIRHMSALKRQLANRPQELAAAAADYGYRPAPDRIDAITEEMRTVPRFKNSNLTLTQLLRKEARGGERWVLDFTSVGKGRSSTNERGTIYGLRFEEPGHPRFLFRHSGMKMPKLLVFALEKAVDFRYPGFERVALDATSPDLAHSLMFAENRDSGVRVLTQDFIGALSRHPNWGLESTGSWLFADRQNPGENNTPSVATVVEELREFEVLADAFTS
jgi:hypothetical protein